MSVEAMVQKKKRKTGLRSGSPVSSIAVVARSKRAMLHARVRTGAPDSPDDDHASVRSQPSPRRRLLSGLAKRSTPVHFRNLLPAKGKVHSDGVRSQHTSAIQSVIFIISYMPYQLNIIDQASESVSSDISIQCATGNVFRAFGLFGRNAEES